MGSEANRYLCGHAIKFDRHDVRSDLIGVPVRNLPYCFNDEIDAIVDIHLVPIGKVAPHEVPGMLHVNPGRKGT